MRACLLLLLAGSLTGSPARGQEGPTAADTTRLPPIEAHAPRIFDRSQARSVEFLRVGRGAMPYVDLADWLASRTAVQVRGYGGGGRQLLTVRGSRPEGVLVLLDGLPVNDPVSGIADLSAISLPSLRSASLVRGAGSARYGSGALGGALVLTTAGGRPRTAGQLTAGSGGRLDASLSTGIGGRAGRLMLTAARRYSRNDFRFQNRTRPGEPEEQRRNADSEMNSLTLDGSTGNARASVRYDQLDRGVPGRMGTSLFAGDRWSEDRWSATGAVGWSQTTFSAGIRSLRLRYSPAGIPGSDQRAFDGRVGVETALGAATALAVRGSYERISGHGIDGTPDRAGVGVSVRRRFVTGRPGAAGAGIEPVLGVDYVGDEITWSPEIGAWLRPSPSTRVYGRAGQGFRLPTFGDLHFGAAPGVRANPELRAERVTLDAEIGFEGGFSLGSGTATARVAAFARHTNRPIVWLASSASLWSPRNLDRLRARGLDMEAGIGTDPTSIAGLAVEAGLTVQESRVGFGMNRNPLPYQPDVAGRISVEGRHGPLALSLSAQFTGSRTTSIAATRRLPALTVIDVMIRRRIELGSLALGFAVRVDNLFDRRYELIELFPEPGRQLVISLEFF